MNVAYLVNQYPKGSHTFIRREILALERQGVAVRRFALRGWDAEVVDPADHDERQRTRYLLAGGVVPLAQALLATALRHPLRFAGALLATVRIGRRADRPLAVHLVYLAEACLLARWCADEGIAHVHAHFGTNATTVALLARLLGGPTYSFTVHGPEEFDKPEFLHLAEKIRRAVFVVAVSAFGRSQLMRWADVADWNKLHVVHCGLDADDGVSEDVVSEAPTLICIGRFSEQKGHLLLVEALARLRSRGCRFKVVLAGDGELRRAIEDAVRAAELDDCVRITGWISGARVRRELLDARALVVPSFAEGLPIVCMEAMALRRPVLSTWVAGIPELVRDGREGLLFPPGDVPAMVDALERFLALPTASVVEMGRSARERVLTRHSIDVSATRLRSLFGGARSRQTAPAADPVPAAATSR